MWMTGWWALVVAAVLVAGREQETTGLRKGVYESRVTTWSELEAATKDSACDTMYLAADVLLIDTLRIDHKVSISSSELRRQVLDGLASLQLVVVESGGDVMIQDTILANGVGFGGGAVDVKEGGRLELRRCMLVGNSAVVGGAVHVAEQGRFVARESTFVLNRAYYGGAIFVAHLATAALTDVELRENTAIELGSEVVSINSEDDTTFGDGAVAGVQHDDLVVLTKMPDNLAGLDPPRAMHQQDKPRPSAEQNSSSAEMRRRVMGFDPPTPTPTFETPVPTFDTPAPSA